MEIDEDFVCTQNITVYNFKNFDASQCLFHFKDPYRLLKCKPGNYDVVRYELYGYDEWDFNNFDLALVYEGPNNDNFESMSGTNKVTSIKRIKNGVVIEGKFDAEMSNAYYADRVDGVRSFRMTGKYRMTVLLNLFDDDL